MPSRPAARGRDGRRGEWTVAAATAGSAAVLAWMLVTPVGGAPTGTPAETTVAPQAFVTGRRPSVALSADDRTGRGAPGPLHSPTVAVAPGAAAVTREGAAVSLDLASVGLEHAVELLARATRSTVHGAEALAGRAETVTLRARAGSALEAWRQLIGDQLNAAVACTASRCDVWIVGPMHPGHRPAPLVSTAVVTAAFEARSSVELPAPGMPAATTAPESAPAEAAADTKSVETEEGAN